MLSHDSKVCDDTATSVTYQTAHMAEANKWIHFAMCRAIVKGLVKHWCCLSQDNYCCELVANISTLAAGVRASALDEHPSKGTYFIAAGTLAVEARDLMLAEIVLTSRAGPLFCARLLDDLRVFEFVYTEECKEIATLQSTRHNGLSKEIGSEQIPKSTIAVLGKVLRSEGNHGQTAKYRQYCMTVARQGIMVFSKL